MANPARTRIAIKLYPLQIPLTNKGLKAGYIGGFALNKLKVIVTGIKACTIQEILSI